MAAMYPALATELMTYSPNVIVTSFAALTIVAEISGTRCTNEVTLYGMHTDVVSLQEELFTETPFVRRALSSTILRDPLFWIGLAMFVGLLFFCFVGPMFDRANPDTIHLNAIAHPPSAQWTLGTDDIGRSEMVRLMFGGRLILLIGLAASLVSTVLGLTTGILSGYLGGATDRILTWVMDVILSVPQLIPLLLIENLLTPTPDTMIFVVAATSWPLVGRPVRAQVLSLREREYVKAAESLGAGRVRVMMRHVMPGLWSLLLTTASATMGLAVLVVATASFLGFSLPPPWPNWGSMIAQSLQVIYEGYWWLLVFPGAAFVVLQLSLNFISDAARDALARGTGVGL